MSVYDKLTQSMANRNVDAYIDLLHEDFTVVFHKSGSSFGKEEWSSMAREMMANDKFIQESTRCVYENSEILVEHSFMSFPDGSKEAVLAVWTKRNDKFIKVETGATPIK